MHINLTGLSTLIIWLSLLILSLLFWEGVYKAFGEEYCYDEKQTKDVCEGVCMLCPYMRTPHPCSDPDWLVYRQYCNSLEETLAQCYKTGTRYQRKFKAARRLLRSKLARTNPWVWRRMCK